MHGERDIKVLYEFYRQEEYGGAEMIRFLDLVTDILRAKLVYFGTSHGRLILTCIGTYPECADGPMVVVGAHGEYVNLEYVERWDDGPYFRAREDHIRCKIEHARAALLEHLARLKPPAA